MAPCSMYEMSMLSQTDQIAWLRQLLLALPDGYAAHVTAVHRHGGDGCAAMEADVCWQYLLLTISPRHCADGHCSDGLRPGGLRGQHGRGARAWLAGHRPVITCLDPHPNAFRARAAHGRPPCRDRAVPHERTLRGCTPGGQLRPSQARECADREGRSATPDRV